MSQQPDDSTHADRIARLFDAVSSVYDGVGVDFFQPIASGLLEAMPPREGERWLDIGCGRGAVLLPAAEGVGARGTVIGTDISPAMVEATASLARERGLAQVRVTVDDAQVPEPLDEPVDTISSCLVLFFLTDPAAALRAWLPLLAPGGRLGVTTFGPIDPRWHQVDDVFTPFLPPAMRDARTSGQQGPFSTDAAMEQLVSDAGYTEVRTVTGSLDVRFADVEQWHEFTWSTGQRMMWLSVPEDERAAVRAEAELRVSEHAAPDGSVVFSQDVRHTLAVRPT